MPPIPDQVTQYAAYQKLQAALPWQRERLPERKILFDKFDTDGNGSLNADEVHAALNREFNLESVVPNSKGAVVQAFEEAKNYAGNNQNAAAVDKREFRMMLELLHNHLEELQGRAKPEMVRGVSDGTPTPFQKETTILDFTDVPLPPAPIPPKPVPVGASTRDFTFEAGGGGSGRSLRKPPAQNPGLLKMLFLALIAVTVWRTTGRIPKGGKGRDGRPRVPAQSFTPTLAPAFVLPPWQRPALRDALASAAPTAVTSAAAAARVEHVPASFYGPTYCARELGTSSAMLCAPPL